MIQTFFDNYNKDYANASNNASNWFGMDIGYEYGFSQNQLNGNIAGIKWRNGNDQVQRSYGFSYDAANRLSKADFTQYAGSAWNTSAGVDFSTRNLTYDNNGNILSMSQIGLKLSTSIVIDSLLYSYNTNSNQLNYVTDKANDTTAHLGDFTEINNNTTQDYTYDGNGSMTVDNNKGISNIHYNYLNLPDSISITGKGDIKYIYDAAGNKEQKITIDNKANKKTVTTYSSGAFIYQYTAVPSTGTGNDTLQYIMTEEGRARPKSVNHSDTLLYDFFEKDHLGNVRVVLTDEKKQDLYPVASLENAAGINLQNTYYYINTADTIGTSRIPSWNTTTGKNYVNNNGNPPYNPDPYVNTTAVSNIVYKLNGNTDDKTGLGITLKVMKGDVVDIFGKSFWHSNGVNPVNTYSISSVLTSFINVFAGTPVVSSHGITGTALNNAPATTSGLNSWLTNVPNPTLTSVPKAYINWILFDEQFKPISSGSGYDLVSTSPDLVKNHHSTVTISNGGYLYVYCSNESNVDVFFDNLQVTQTRGPLLETTDYYPFGLTMAGISDKAAGGGLINQKKYNGIEFDDDLDLDTYEALYRNLDPQIGRFWQIDPKIDSLSNWSPYISMFDNPIKFMDPLGDSSIPQQTYKPAPKELPGFPDAGKREYNKESSRYRWKLNDGTILEWDKQHGEVEKYDKSGKKHQGSFDPNTGKQIKDKGPVAGRTTPKIVGTDNYIAGLSPSYSVTPETAKTTSKILTESAGSYVAVKAVEVGLTIFSGGGLSWTLLF